MNTDFMKGVIVPILTPIDENEWIDEIKMREPPCRACRFSYRRG